MNLLSSITFGVGTAEYFGEDRIVKSFLSTALTNLLTADATGLLVEANNWFTHDQIQNGNRNHNQSTFNTVLSGVAGSSFFFTFTDAGTSTTTSYEISASPTGAPTRNIREASRILGGSGRGYQRFVQPGYEQKLITGTVSGFSLTETIDQSSVVTPYAFVLSQAAGSLDYSFAVAPTQTAEQFLINSNQLDIVFDGTWYGTYTASTAEVYQFIVSASGANFQMQGAGTSVLDLGEDGTITLDSTTGLYVLTTAPAAIAVPEDIVFRAATGELLINDFTDTAIKMQNAIVGAREVVDIDDTDSPYALVAGDEIILADTTGGAIIVNLPTAASAVLTGKSRVITIMVTSSTAANTLTIEPDGAELIQDKGAALAANIVSNAAGDIGKSWTVISNGTNWYVI